MNKFRRRLMYDKNSIKRVNYLQSNGDAYINTNMLVTDKQIIRIRISVLSGTGGAFGWRWGGNVNGNNHALISAGGSNVTAIYGIIGAGGLSTLFEYNTIYDFEFNPIENKLIINGLYEETSNAQNAYKNGSSVFAPYLFGANLIGKLSIIKSRIYNYCVINENGDVAMNLIPVRVNGEGYMLDTITNNLLGNSGNGKFIIG